jgi:hypothetical protein
VPHAFQPLSGLSPAAQDFDKYVGVQK